MADRISSLQAALKERYVIERELGHGAMATVYLADDLRHGRRVALKVLHAESGAALGAERFEREIRLVARLQHPHILPVLDSGDAGTGSRRAGRLWFSMPFVDGESLRERLAREGQIPIDDAVRIGGETARALDYAHRHGIIHRDIKPENILITRDGDALVADFGIGRSYDENAPPDRITESGTIVGTPAYMSPEQAAGEGKLDGRTDIYALAVVLYEALAGEPPYTGPSAMAVMAKRFTGVLPSIRKRRPAVPVALEQVLGKALANAPADRYASAAEFAQALGAAISPGSGPVEAPVAPDERDIARAGIRIVLAAAFAAVLVILIAMMLLRR